MNMLNSQSQRGTTVTNKVNSDSQLRTDSMLVVLQRSGGQLQEAQARSVLIGVGPAVPPPQMAGLETRVTSSINSSWTHNPGVCRACNPQLVPTPPLSDILQLHAFLLPLVPVALSINYQPQACQHYAIALLKAL